MEQPREKQMLVTTVVQYT